MDLYDGDSFGGASITLVGEPFADEQQAMRCIDLGLLDWDNKISSLAVYRTENSGVMPARGYWEWVGSAETI